MLRLAVLVSGGGTNLQAILDAIDALPAPDSDVPTVIIGKTVKGHGVSFMENQAGWHGKAPNDEEYKIAMDELTAAMVELEAAK